MTDNPAADARFWLAAIGETLVETIPEPFVFVLAIYRPGKPGAMMVSPQDPEIVVPILRDLADTIESGDPNFLFRAGDAVPKPEA